jgi:hypothetical protein
LLWHLKCGIFERMSWGRLTDAIKRVLTSNPMLGALVVSLVLHTILLTLWVTWAAVLASASFAADPDLIHQNLVRAQQNAQARETMVFIEVLPEQQAQEAPENAKFYSTVNAEAANPEAVLDTDTPKIDGDQIEIAKTFDTPQPQPLQPTPPPEPEPLPEPEPEPPQPLQPEPPPEPPQQEQPGDLALAKPLDPPETPRPEPEPTPEPERPRRLEELLDPQGVLAGRRMQQDGGVRRRARIATPNTLSTPFGQYDYRMIQAIQKRWYDLLDRQDFARDRIGKVVLEFQMHPDGSVSGMRIAENNVGDLLSLLCQNAILDNAPYEPWPQELRLMVPGDTREARFTFYYQQ